MNDRRDTDFAPGPDATLSGVLRRAWLSTLLPFVVCLPLWAILQRAPQTALAEVDRLELGVEIVALCQVTTPGGERLVVSGADGRAYLIGRPAGRLTATRLELPYERLGRGPVYCTVADDNADGLDDLVVRRLLTPEEYAASTESTALGDTPPPYCAVLLQQADGFAFDRCEQDRRADPGTSVYGLVCHRWLVYRTRPDVEDTLLLPVGRSTGGRRLTGQLVDVADLTGDGSDELLTVVPSAESRSATLTLYQALGRSYRVAWTATVDALTNEFDTTCAQPLAALADLDDDWRAELVLCRRAPGVVFCYEQSAPEPH